MAAAPGPNQSPTVIYHNAGDAFVRLDDVNGRHIPHIGALAVPMPGIKPNENIAHWAHEIHHFTAWLMLVLLLLHLSATLYHHWFLKDDIWQRMRPGTKKP